MIELEKLPQHLEALSPGDWDRLFELIPEIERTQDFRGHTEIISKTASVISELRINPAFDWMAWKEGEAMATSRNHDYSQLDTITSCKLLAAIIRADRFTDGFLADCFERGVIAKILRALKNNVYGSDTSEVV